MLFLRFPSEEAYLKAVDKYKDEEGNLPINLDVIGTIYEGGEYGEDGEIITPPYPVKGWHINALEVEEDLEKYIIDRPKKPHRIYLGR